MWIEIFRTGAWTDSQGRTRTWTEEDLDKIVAKYDPQKHEAPVTIGHPKSNSPAWAWVKALKREGDRLLAKIGDMAPEFTEWLKKKLFKKRSMSLYPDLTLRHVGFLGAQPPAVKGLKDVEFGDQESIGYEFEEDGNQQGVNMGNQTQNQTQTGQQTRQAQQVPQSQQNQQTQNNGAATAGVSNADIQRLQQQVAQFQEALKERDQLIQQLQQQVQQVNQERKTAEFSQFVNGLVSKGKLLPADAPTVVAFMQALDGQEIEFQEGDKSEKRNMVIVFQEFLERLPVRVTVGPLHYDHLEGDKDQKNASPVQIVARAIREGQ